MAKKIFALQGIASCGKSSTIKMIFFLLMQTYHKTMKIKSFSINTISHDDITVQIEINGLLIGIESEGDPNSQLEQNLNEFDKANCDIIFCPVRTSGMTEKWVNSHSPKYEIIFHNQIIIEEKSSRSWKMSQFKSNLEIAEQLIKEAGL